MNKDVIYIDTEDDVTAIIGKVKEAKEKVVALVPPKRTGVLQSAVNLRILLRTTKSAGKHLVLITNDSSLIPLAAETGIPVAKNLQSRPEVPEVPALIVDDDDDIIDGSQLPVGDHASSTGKTAAAAKHIPVTTSSDSPKKKAYAAPPKDGDSPRKPKGKAAKVPNFSTFRKKLILIIVGVLLLIGFLVWAIFFAPRATVELSAKTSNESIATAVVLDANGKTSADEGVIRALKVEEQVAKEIEFEATGTEERGENATGTITVTRTSINRRTITIPVGTGFSNGDYTFTTTREVSLGPPVVGDGLEYPQRDVPVRATQIGSEYNLSPRSYDSTVDGVSARGGAMTGGSRETVTIVTQADVQRATEQLAAQGGDDVKKQLIDRLPRSAVAIESSFRNVAAEVASTPEVGDEASGGKATLTSSITYAMNGVSKAELEKYIEKAVDMRISKESDQRIYESGVEGVIFDEFAPNDNGGTANLSVTAKVGPQVQDDDIKKRAAGKRFGEIQSDLQSIQGIDDVDVKFWPFWVNTVPDNHERINVKFNLIDNEGTDS